MRTNVYENNSNIDKITDTLVYIENNLESSTDSFTMEQNLCKGNPHLKKGFEFIIGYRIKNYIDCRRLYIIAEKILKSDDKLSDLAKRYGMDDSTMSRAFKQFHGCLPSQLKKDPSSIRIFEPFDMDMLRNDNSVLNPVIDNYFFPTIYGFNSFIYFDNSDEQIRRFNASVNNRFLNTPLSKQSVNYIYDHYGIITEYPDRHDCFGYMVGVPFLKSPYKSMTSFSTSHSLWAKFSTSEEEITMHEFHKETFNIWKDGYDSIYRICGPDIIEHYVFDYLSNRHIKEIFLPIEKRKPADPVSTE